MKISIIIPAHNEEENIGEVIRRIEDLTDVPCELIVVNDHSIDKTKEVVEGLCGRYSNLRLVENVLPGGFGNAIKTGFKSADTEAAVLVMADLCDDLTAIKKMTARIEEGFDVVCGSRYAKGGRRLGGSKLKAFFSSFVGHSLKVLLNLPTYDIANAFKMYRKTVLESIDIQSEGFEISMEIPLKAFFLGFKITEVPTVWRERERGESSFKMHKLMPNYLRVYLWAIFKKLRG